MLTPANMASVAVNEFDAQCPLTLVSVYDNDKKPLALLDGHRLGKISGLVDVRAFEYGDMIGE